MILPVLLSTQKHPGALLSNCKFFLFFFPFFGWYGVVLGIESRALYMLGMFLTIGQ